MLRRIFLLALCAFGVGLPDTGGGSDSARVLRADRRIEKSSGFLPPVEFVALPAGPVGEIILSFDDGPDIEGTPAIMAELDRRGLKGIFFVNGRHLVGSRPKDMASRDIVRTLAAHGHLVANHGFSHKNLCRSPGLMAVEVDGNAEIIANSTGIRPRLFRSPYGARCRKLEQALAERELVSVGWDLDPQDWRNGNPDTVFKHVVRRLSHLSRRAVLLMHDTHPSAVKALPRILDWIAGRSRHADSPVRIGDYTVFFPDRKLPATGFEPLWADLASTFSVVSGIPAAAPASGLR